MPLAQSQPMSRMKLLKAATLQSMHASQPSGRVPRSKDLAAALRKENLSINKPNSETNQDPSRRGAITAESLRKMSFHPQTMPKPRAPEVLPSQIEQDDGNNAMGNNVASMMGIDRPSFSSPTTSRRHRASKSHGNSKGGPWTKRLAALKSNQTNDAMKLQHPGMNRHAFDLNDPRKKAKSYTDVTILSDEECHGAVPKSWSLSASGTASSGDGSLMTVLGHIHQHGPIHRGYESPTMSTKATASKQAFAWISFTRMTARNIGLRKGMELRLYDAVLLPARRIGAEGASHNEDEMDCRFLVICTQLCEKHPGKLNPVPNLDVAAFLPATSKD
jgi:hypothetical protein